MSSVMNVNKFEFNERHGFIMIVFPTFIFKSQFFNPAVSDLMAVKARL